MEIEYKEIELVECPNCHQIVMPKGNNFCCIRCYDEFIVNYAASGEAVK